MGLIPRCLHRGGSFAIYNVFLYIISYWVHNFEKRIAIKTNICFHKLLYRSCNVQTSLHFPYEQVKYIVVLSVLSLSQLFPCQHDHWYAIVQLKRPFLSCNEGSPQHLHLPCIHPTLNRINSPPEKRCNCSVFPNMVSLMAEHT